MADFERFIHTNKLKKKDIAAFLSVSSAFITQLSSGLRQIPDDKLALIKANKSWDTSMFCETGHKPSQESIDISRALSIIESQQETINRQSKIIETLTNK